MDREELDRQLKEQGKNIELQTDKFCFRAEKTGGRGSGSFDYQFHRGMFLR